MFWIIGFSPLKWNVKAVTITGTAVKRLKKETPLSNSGRNLGVFVSPWMRAATAIAVHIPTNTIARRTDIAELSHSDSANSNQKQDQM